jgi:hypothetical protein
MSAEDRDGGGASSLPQKRVRALVEGLQVINGILTPPVRADEVYIMQVGTHNGAESITLAKVTDRDREPDMSHLFSLMAEVWTAGKGHGKVVTLDGQEGENFDFVVVVAFNGSDYYGFGNYLGGDFQALSSDPAWPQAEKEFVKMVTQVVTMME